MAGTAYPKIPDSNWWKLRDQFKKTMPGAVTTAYLRSLLGLNSEGAAQNLLNPLRQVGLIDDENKPKPRANEWRNDAKYSDVCKEMIAEVYPQELRDLYSGTDLDRRAVENWFMHAESLGQAAAARNAQFYVLLNDGVPRSSEGPTKKGEVKPKAAATKRSTPAKATAPASTNVSPPPDTAHKDGSVPAVHMDFQIHISPEAGAEQIDAIFAAMAKHLYPKK